MVWDRLPTELAAFAEQLGKERSTERTADFIRTYYAKFDHDWRTCRTLRSEVDGAPIPPPRDQGLHPTGCSVSEAFLQFDFHLGEISEDTENVFPRRADFQVRVLGRLDLPDSIVELEDHWRVDTHFYAGAGEPKEPHPHFHFQRGGHAQDGFAALDGFVPGAALPARGSESWRGLLQSPGPRILFPPMCPILAIDFAIGQHNGLVWRRLRAIPEYQRIVQNAQLRLWTPFFDALISPQTRRRWIGALLI
jgi:hypothetical protein